MTQAAERDVPRLVSGAALPAQHPSAAAGRGHQPALAAEDSAQFAARAAVAAERARIARDLDDAACKSLLGVAMVADSLAAPRWSADPRSLDDRLRELARLARRAVTEARGVVDGLRDDGLGDAVRGLATAWGIVAGVSVSLAVPRAGDTSQEIRSGIIDILREALLNVEHHAQASHAQVSLRTDGGLLLTVTDNGIGFCPPADLDDFRPVAHTGLSGMRERARSLSGDLIIRSWPGRGTRIEARIPAPEMARQQLWAVPSGPPVRVVIADGNPVLRFGLRALLDNRPATEVVAEAANGPDAAEQVRRHHADVVLLDARLTAPDGLAAIRQLGRLAEVVVLGWADDISLVRRAVAAGASGYVVHGEFEPGDLIRVVLEAARRKPGAAQLDDQDLTGPFLRHDGPAGAGHAGLRPREREIMHFIAEGLSNRQIAAALVISEKTVKNHICSIYRRLGVPGRSQAISQWRES